CATILDRIDAKPEFFQEADRYLAIDRIVLGDQDAAPLVTTMLAQEPRRHDRVREAMPSRGLVRQYHRKCFDELTPIPRLVQIRRKPEMLEHPAILRLRGR